MFGLLIVLIFCFPAHEWVREGGEASEIPLDISVLHNMRQFVKYSRFKQFALRVSWYARIDGDLPPYGATSA